MTRGREEEERGKKELHRGSGGRNGIRESGSQSGFPVCKEEKTN